ncbi:hypothetical protein MYK68_03500 [Gordonia sp. PP30]|uniref:hypothetical protein n=1 Tax=Gordonia sp. PP30 TaxID=2935861 RepID=UPI001FFEC6C8|nr:hypothetical protein [Gordonia sp. PP30]UQE75697.1 hypothetical protein MYK68_03500 [Gordonia sp. PP30]
MTELIDPYSPRPGRRGRGPRRTGSPGPVARTFDALGALVLWLLQMVAAAIGFFLSALAAIGTDSCDDSTPCGGAGYIDAGMTISLISGVVLALGVLTWCVSRFCRERLCWWVGLLGLGAQAVFTIIAVALAVHAGPIH